MSFYSGVAAAVAASSVAKNNPTYSQEDIGLTFVIFLFIITGVAIIFLIRKLFSRRWK